MKNKAPKSSQKKEYLHETIWKQTQFKIEREKGKETFLELVISHLQKPF